MWYIFLVFTFLSLRIAVQLYHKVISFIVTGSRVSPQQSSLDDERYSGFGSFWTVTSQRWIRLRVRERVEKGEREVMWICLRKE